MPTEPARLPKRVWVLGWISFFADVASEMVYPIIPIFLTTVLKAPATALGAIEGFAEAIVSFMKGWSGWHSDRTGKRLPYVRWGYGLSAVGKPLLGLATAWPTVFLARSTDRLGKGLRTSARDALIADAVDRSIYGRAFGLHRAMDTAGAFVGGLLAIVLLLLLPDNLRAIFFVAALPGLASVVLTFALREPELPAATHAEKADQGTFAQLRETLREMPPAYWRAVTITLLFGLANSSDTFLLLRANQVFQEGNPLGARLAALSPETAALIVTTLAYTLYNITYVATSYPAGLLSDRIGRWRVLAAGFVLYAGVYSGFAFANSSSIWMLFALYGVYAGLTNGVGKALVADHAPSHARGTAIGFFTMASGGITLAGNVVAGLLWDFVGPQATFFAGSGIALAVVLLIPLSRRWR